MPKKKRNNKGRSAKNRTGGHPPGVPERPVDKAPRIGVPVHLPDEILWGIFTLYLLTTDWSGWSKLLRLNWDFSERLREDTSLIRQTLPLLRGGIPKTLGWLLERMRSLLEEERSHILYVINGVASGLDYSEVHSEPFFQRFVVLHYDHDKGILPYIDLLNTARCSSLSGPSLDNFNKAMKHLRGIREKPHEYDRYQTTVQRHHDIMLITTFY